MRYVLAICIAVILTSLSQAQNGLVVKSNIDYGKAIKWDNQNTDLKLDLIYPQKATMLPLIVFVHGGAFAKEFTKEGSQELCKKISRQGFVVANVEYRLGFDQTGDLMHELMKALYRANQDASVAIQYLMKHASEIPFDTQKVFLAGESAGGFISLSLAYVNQQKWNGISSTLESQLGSVNKSENEPSGKLKLKGIINIDGGIADTSLISKEDMQTVPVLMFHSVDDEEVPFQHGANKDVRHLNGYNLNVYGSYDIASRFKNNQGCYQLYFVKDASHGHGFSGDYVSKAIKKFADEVLAGQCKSGEIENANSNIALSTSDAEMPAPEYTFISLPSGALKEYEGKYAGNNTVVTITVRDNYLIVQPAGDSPKKLYPIGKDKFLIKQFYSEAAFARDLKGQIVEHILSVKNLQSGKRDEYRFKKIE